MSLSAPRRWLPLTAACLSLFALALAGCFWRKPAADATPAGPVLFEDVTASSGLDFVHDPGPTGTYFMPQSMGSGCAFFDFDGDGLLDVYLLHQGGPDGKKNQLFRQTAPGKFTDVSAGSGLDVAGVCTGVAVADVNNDGLPDVLLTLYGGVRLFLNKGGGKFEDVSEKSGLVNPLWATSAAFLDFDRDGWLDLVIVNYLDYDPKRACHSPEGKLDYCGPNDFAGTPTKLFRNLGGSGKLGQFEDVSFASGIGRVKGPGLGVTVADFDGDGWTDIFVSNDGQPNRLWINKHDGTFEDQAVSRNVATTGMGKAYAGMGVAVADTSGSGMLDLFVTHLDIETHTLWKQGPRGRFTDVTVKAGLTATRWRGTGFGTLFADFDNDGWPDVAIVNGRVIRGGKSPDEGLGFFQTYAERNQLLLNDGGKFRDVSEANPAFCGYWNVGRGLACGDFDNDGAPDLLVLATGGKARLFRNVAPNRGHWLKVRAIDPKLKRDAYGAEVRVKAGGRTQLRLINPAESFLSSSAPIASFGLGESSAYDSIEVTWPGEGANDPVRETFKGGPADRALELRKGEGNRP
jgi:hypothetical protein